MTEEQKQLILDSFKRGLKPITDLPLWEWLEKNVELPTVYNPAGTFRIDFYPYLKKPMLALLNNNIKQVNIAACTQGGKSLLEQLYIPFIILEDSGPLLMVHDTADNAKKCVEERIIPLLKSNKDTKRLLDTQRFSARKSGVQLPHMTMRVSGPAESNILGYTARYILGDEIWQWEATNHIGILEKLENRQTAYNATRKILLTSQPDREGSEWYRQCEKGMWYEYGYRCPHCNTLQRYEWNEETEAGKPYGMIMDKTIEDPITGKPDYEKKASSARLVCEKCLGEIHDTPESRKNLVMNGDYILIHKGKNEAIHTYSWPQYMNRSVTFKDIALRYLNAVTYKRETGLRDKHEIFTQQTLGRFFKMGRVLDLPKLMIEAYQPNDNWVDETIRFLTLDVQKDHIFWLIRSWSNKVPECRLVDWGTVIGFSEIDEITTKYKIHPLCIGVDSGYDTKNIYAESIQRGKVINLNSGKRIFAQWRCLKGDGGPGLVPKKFYKHKIVENGKTIEIDRLYSPMTTVDPQLSSTSKFKPFRAELYAWSNYSIKTILFNLRDKRLPFKWSLNERANGDYTQQMFSEELTPKGRYQQIKDTPNHILDLEAMQLVMALMSDCYHPAPSELTALQNAPEIT